MRVTSSPYSHGWGPAIRAAERQVLLVDRVPEQFLAMGFALAGALSYAVASVTQQQTA
jgi:hypothetical protein